ARRARGRRTRPETTLLLGVDPLKTIRAPRRLRGSLRAVASGARSVGAPTQSVMRRILVREFVPSDLDAAIELWAGSDGVGLNESDSRDALLRFLARNPGLSAVAVDAAQLVGAILCGHDGRRGAIHHLVVAPGYRRRGIGS